jgi:large subunit ribosomal protein L18
MKFKQGPRYVVKYKRQRKGQTDYKSRLRLLKSGKPRLVIRKSANAVNCQIITSGEKGDMTLTNASSLELKKYGYTGHTGNLPAAYLTGYMCGLQAKKRKITEAVPDIGLYRSTKGSRLYAVIKGAIDAGLKMPYDPKNFPDEKRIKGMHIEEYKKTPGKISGQFEEVKKKLSGAFV